MRSIIVAAATGIAAVSLLPALYPAMLPATLVSALLLLALRRWAGCRRLSLLVALLLGAGWSIAYGLSLLRSQLPDTLEQVPLTVVGTIADLPVAGTRYGEPLVRFEFIVESVHCAGRQPDCAPHLRRLRLSWSGPPAIEPGQRWQLSVTARRPHGLMNPGGFDYQTWLQRRGVGGVGQVSGDADNRLLGVAYARLDYWRGRLAQRLDRQLQDYRHSAVLKALLIADKRAISDKQWQLFRRYGLVHLMVISGLHIGLVGGLVFALARWLLLLTPVRHRAMPLAALLSLLAALLYCLAAGASLPTQRALITLALVMVGLWRRRQGWARDALLQALLACLLLDPLAVVSASFWLSFGAVLVLAIGLSGQLGATPRWRRALRGQWVMCGLAPVLAAAIGEFSLLAPLVNLVAIPVFSLLVVPLALLGLVLLPLPDAAHACWWLADQVLQGIVQALQWIGNWLPVDVWRVPQLPLLLLLSTALGALLCIAPRGFPLRYLGWLLLLPLLCYRPPPPPVGGLNLTVLDVGQGLSVVVQSAGHVLVYDVGARYEQGNQRYFSMAEAALIPFLRSRGIARIDTLVLSHGDNDHAGGRHELLATIPVDRVLVGEPLAGLRAASCHTAGGWEWDGIRFRFLPVEQLNPPNHSSAAHSSPGASIPELYNAKKGNSRSCVLQIEVGGQAILLPGDIGAAQEQSLARSYPDQLAASLLIASHHGSQSSSSWAFIKQVRPRHVVFSSGYHNPFGHPHPQVVERFRQLRSELYNTSASGALEFRWRDGKLLSPTHYRRIKRRYWL